MQLAVMLRTSAERYTGPTPLPVYIVDGGLTAADREKVLQSVPRELLELHWCLPGELSAAEFFVSNHITLSTYFRLFLSDVIPSTVDRVVYIDADVAVLGDINKLFEMSMEDHIVWARQQVAPANWEFSPRETYFNAGVLVIDPVAWRNESVGERALKFAREHGSDNTEWDQGALNVVLRDQWGLLDNHWNLEPVPSNLDLITDPKSGIGIVHFLGVGKPWNSDYPYPTVQKFYFELLDGTAWKGWRPPRGVEWFARTLARVPLVKLILKSSSALRRRFGLNYSSLYRFFRGR